MAVPLQGIDYTARDFDTIVEFLRNLVSTENPDLWSDFFESNIGQNFIDMIAVQGDILSYVANQISREMFLPTCQRYASALKHAKLVGYVPRLKTAASVTLQIKPPFPEETYSASIRFLALQEITIGDLTFQIPEEIILVPHDARGTNTSVAVGKLIDAAATFIADGRAPGQWIINTADGKRTQIATVDSEIQLTLNDDRFGTIGIGYTVRNGDPFAITASHSVHQEDQYVSDGTSFQSFTTEEFPVLADTWEVYVNNILWTETDSLLISQATYVYEASVTATATLEIRFGDNLMGAIPPLNAIIDVVYKTGGGIEGNLTANASDGAQVLGYIGSTSYRLALNNSSSATGGADEETLNELRLNIPAWVRTADKAVTKEDYDTLARTFEDSVYGAVARAVAQLRYVTPSGPPLSGPYGNYVDVYVWAYSNDDSFEPPSLGLKQALHEYLKARRVVTVQVCVQDGVNVPVNLDMGVVIIGVQFVEAEVAADIDQAVRDFFTDAAFQPGQSFRLSDFYGTIESVAGVDHFQMVAPTADISILDTELIVRGTVAYVLQYPPVDIPTVGPCP